MIEITPSLSINESEIQYEFIRSSGPGGQNVNKVATAVHLRFDARNAPSLPEEVKARLERLAGSRMTADGVILIEAKQYRTQEQNRADALLRLVELLREAARRPKMRRATRPTLASKARRLEQKHQKSEVKHLRYTARGGNFE